MRLQWSISLKGPSCSLISQSQCDLSRLSRFSLSSIAALSPPGPSPIMAILRRFLHFPTPSCFTAHDELLSVCATPDCHACEGRTPTRPDGVAHRQASSEWTFNTNSASAVRTTRSRSFTRHHLESDSPFAPGRCKALTTTCQAYFRVQGFLGELKSASNLSYSCVHITQTKWS